MEYPWTILFIFISLALCFAATFLFALIIEAYKRRFNREHVEAPAIFEDPNSLKRVPCPSIFDPAEKYMSLIVPAFNEEYRLHGALEETINLYLARYN